MAESEPQAAPAAAPLRKRRWYRVTTSAARVVLGCFVLLAVFTRLAEKWFIYHPSKHPEGDWDAPSRSRLAVEDVSLAASDGVKLHGWFVKAKDARATLLYLHGNAGNVAQRWYWIRDLSTLPANVLAIDYRGYGRSEGAPSERGIYLDAEAAYRWLTDSRGIPPSRIVIYGKSLGGAPACELATRLPCAGVILQSAFTNIPDMANEIIPLFPAGWFVKTGFDNAAKVAMVAVPKLIVHSRKDELVPYWMAERLHAAAVEPKRLVTFETGSHTGLIVGQGAKVLEAYRKFIKGCVR